MSKTEELLRKLRGRLAYCKQVKPYMIFRDVELEELLKVQPKSLEQLATIKGFPIDGKRVQGYGQSIIDIFTRANQIEDFEVQLDRNNEPISQTKMIKMNLF